MKEKLTTLEAALSPIVSGSTVMIGGSLLRRQPNAAVRQLIRNGIDDLTVMSWAGTTAVDMPLLRPSLSRVRTGAMHPGPDPCQSSCVFVSPAPGWPPPAARCC